MFGTPSDHAHGIHVPSTTAVSVLRSHNNKHIYDETDENEKTKIDDLNKRRVFIDANDRERRQYTRIWSRSYHNCVFIGLLNCYRTYRVRPFGFGCLHDMYVYNFNCFQLTLNTINRILLQCKLSNKTEFTKYN